MQDPHGLEPLLRRALAGDPQARADLLGHLRDWARARGQDLAGRGLGPRLDASDIAQEVGLRVHRAFDTFGGQTVPQLLGWADQIVQNVVADIHRRQGADKRDAGREVAGAGLLCEVAGDGTSPSQQAVRHEREARLTEALGQLPEQQRLVFQLRLYEGLPFKEVARRVGVSEGHARVLMLRATERLRQELGDDHEPR
jgi:RNA polymerase sigma-70 factor (ECF subfamily)